MKNCGKERLMSGSRVITVLTQIMVMAVVLSIILLFVGIGILILIHLCIVGRAFRRNSRSDRGGVSSVSPTTSPSAGGGGVVSGNNNGGMSEEDVQKLPSYKHEGSAFVVMGGEVKNNSGVIGFDCTECAVCLDGYQRGDKCRVLPVCRHHFHARCVDAWLYKSPLCPICRTSAEKQHGGEGVKEGLELGRGGDCEARRVDGDVAIMIGGGSGSGFYHVSETPNSLLPRSPPPTTADDDMRYANV